MNPQQSPADAPKQNIENSKLELEIENLKKQNEKLAFENEDLRSEGQLFRNIRRLLPVLSWLITAIAVPGAIFKYAHEQHAARIEREKAESAQTEQQQEARRAFASDLKRETARPFWDKQLGLYLEAVEKAAIISTTNDETANRSAEERFWVLYWGPLAAVEDVGLGKNPAEIEKAMVEFGKLITAAPLGDSKREAMRLASLNLAHAVRNAIAPAFEVELAPLKNLRNQK